MRILFTAIAVMVLAFSVLGQAPVGPVPKGPPQGPPPKNLSTQPDGHVSANTAPASPDLFETHVVQPGDTLSQIAGSVLKDSRLWPQLWEMNEHIVNPHWIYPKDKILIRPITKITEAVPPPAPAPAPVVAEPPARPVVPASRGIAVLSNLIRPNTAAPRSKDIFELPPAKSIAAIKAHDMYCSGFIRSASLGNSLKVESTYQRYAAALSTDGQYVHINKGSGDGVTSGSVYQVIRPTKRVNDPDRKSGSSNVGMHYLDIGQIQVVQLQTDSALARVVGNCESVEVGDVMIPFVHHDVPQLPSNRSFSSSMTTSGGVKGSVIFMKNIVASTGSTYKTTAAFPNSGSVIAEGGILYINLGKGDGVKGGDIFIVYREKVAIGEIAVLKTEDKSASALVTYSTDAFVLGDLVERR